MSEETRNLFVSLPVHPNGTFTDLSGSTQLDDTQLQQSLQHLITLSLVMVGGDVADTRYRLHRLTETFLLNEVIKWQKSDSPDEDEAGETETTTAGATTPFTAPPDHQPQRYLALFRNKIAHALTFWHQHEAVTSVDVPTLILHPIPRIMRL